MSVSAEHIARVRAFNRDYTRRIGVLHEGLLDSPYSLTEVRVMYEIAHRPNITAGELAVDLDLDRGYLSRILKGFEAKKLLAREAAPEDSRRYHLRLTAAGKRVFQPLERRQQEQVQAMLEGMDQGQRDKLLEAMEVIRAVFAAPAAPPAIEDVSLRVGSTPDGPPAVRTRSAAAMAAPTACARTAAALTGSPPALHGRSSQPGFSLRTHHPGDIGWVIQRHGEIYAQEYGWTIEFEALVAEIAAEFIRKFDPARERCWIAERDGERLGCIFLVAKDRTTAKLRLLLVEPTARGMGVGRTLVTECVLFARYFGYQRIVLWTQSILGAARHLYAEAGFQKTAEEPHHSFGHDLIGETWELEL